MDVTEDCPKCLGAIILMEARETKGFDYCTCTLCKGKGYVPIQLAQDFIFSLTENNFNDE